MLQWIEAPDRLQSVRSQRVGHTLVTEHAHSGRGGAVIFLRG